MTQAAGAWGVAAGSFAGTSGLQIGQTGTPVVGDSATFTITGAVHGIPVASPAGTAHPVYAERGLSAGNPICKLEYSTVTANRLGIAYRDNAGTLLNAAGSSTFNDGLPHVFSLVRSSLTDFALWADGRRDSTHTSGTMTASFSGANIECRIGSDKGDTTGAFPGTVALVLLHRRALTDAELAMLHADPFCFLQQPSQLSRIAYAAAVSPPAPSSSEWDLSLGGGIGPGGLVFPSRHLHLVS